jgi:hypothetical protein
LEGAIDAVENKPTFSLDHIQSFTLAISICEAQIRDCIRLAFDTPYMTIDTDNPILKDIRPEAARKVRQRRFVLDGEAVVLGVDGISDFNAVHSRKQDDEVQFCAFDILVEGDNDLRNLPLSTCKHWRDRSCNDDANPAACDYYEARKQKEKDPIE